MDGFGAGVSDSGRPALICLHGFAQHGDSWDEVAALLARRGWEIVAPDLPELALRVGEDGDALGAVCADVAALIRDAFRQSARLPILVGYSMGGRIALEAVLRAQAAGDPLPLGGLVLESAGLGPADDSEHEQLRRRNAEWAARMHDEGVEAFMIWWEDLPLFASQRSLPEGVRASLREGRLRNDSETLALELVGWGQHCQARKAASLACLDGLASRGVPCAYFAGGLDRKYKAIAEEIAVAAASVEVRVFPGAGHNIHLEDPEAFAGALAAWCENTLLRTTPACG